MTESAGAAVKIPTFLIKSAESIDNEDSDSSSLSDSFKSLAKNHKKPYFKEYNNFATSYVGRDIPFTRIFCDGENPTRDVPIPFKNPVLLKEYSVPEKLRLELGPSIRKNKFVLKNSKVILDEIAEANKEFQDQEQRTTFLFLKARQWCELNKALALDEKYPKPDPNVIRRRYSEEHQNAMKVVRQQFGLTNKSPIIPKIKRVAPFPVPAERTKSYDGKIIKAFPVVADKQAKDPVKSPIEKSLERIFADIRPLPGLSRRQQPWQFEASKSLTVVPKPKKKSYWKKNIYPPKSREEIIAEMRSKLPPLKPDHLQTDYLSGIWDPALMTTEFEITPKNYDSRLVSDHNFTGEDPISWYDMRKAKEKCTKWLKKIPDSL